jgi:Tol biopolymer transport system component
VTPDEYCQQKAAQSGSSFYYSFLFLEPARRRAITALYAFCREVDDVADEVADVAVARTKLAFVSDRDNERMVGTVEKRDSKNIYIGDYDGANQLRVTPGQRLNINPDWSPDGRSIAYTSYGPRVPQILISNLYQGTRDTVTDDKSQAFLPVFSPDGTKICFMSDRDGQMDLYVMNRDGSGVRRLTTNPALTICPVDRGPTLALLFRNLQSA